MKTQLTFWADGPENGPADGLRDSSTDSSVDDHVDVRRCCSSSRTDHLDRSIDTRPGEAVFITTPDR